jgi:hypothetical protein
MIVCHLDEFIIGNLHRIDLHNTLAKLSDCGNCTSPCENSGISPTQNQKDPTKENRGDTNIERDSLVIREQDVSTKVTSQQDGEQRDGD